MAAPFSGNLMHQLRADDEHLTSARSLIFSGIHDPEAWEGLECPTRTQARERGDTGGPSFLEYPRWIEARTPAPGSDSRPSHDRLLRWIVQNSPRPVVTPRVPAYRSKRVVPRSLLERIHTMTAIEKLKHPPACFFADEADQHNTTPKEDPRPSTRARHDKKTRARYPRSSVMSIYASIKAEEIRTRRDHEAWVARTEAGLEMPIQDPLSLLGECLRHDRLLRAPTRKGEAVSAQERSASPREIQDPPMMSDRESAAKRYFLSAPHLEGLVASSRRLLSGGDV
ncbi:unnamed protein product [Ascophyllum nodosum]